MKERLCKSVVKVKTVSRCRTNALNGKSYASNAHRGNGQTKNLTQNLQFSISVLSATGPVSQMTEQSSHSH